MVGQGFDMVENGYSLFNKVHMVFATEQFQNHMTIITPKCMYLKDAGT